MSKNQATPCEAISRFDKPTDLLGAAPRGSFHHAQPLELPLKAELGLAGVQRLDEASIRGESVIGARAESIGVVGEVVEADAKQENAVVLPPHEALGGAKGHAEDAALVEGIPVETGRARGEGISAGAIEIGGGERVDGARTAEGNDRREVEVLAEALQPVRRADIVRREFEKAAGDQPGGLILARS